MNARLAAISVMALALLAAGLSTGARVYYVVAFALLLLVLLSFLSAIWALLTVNIDMRGVQGHVTRGDMFMTVFTITHKSLLPISAIRLRVAAPSAYAGAQEISVSSPPFVKRTFRYRVQCPHRGVYEAGVTNISAVDLFGFITLSKKSGKKCARVEVQPRVANVEPMELKVSETGPEMVSRATEDTASPSDVRKWLDGDALKKVHWKLSMRKREILVRTYEEASRPDTLLIPDFTEISAMRDQALSIEDCVCESCAAIAKAQLEAGYPVRMPMICKRPSEIAGQSSADFSKFSDALMRVRFDCPYDYERVLALMTARLQRTGGAVLVTPRLTTRIADTAARIVRAGVRARVVWVTDTRLEQSLEMSERMKMEGVLVERVNPWSEAGKIVQD